MSWYDANTTELNEYRKNHVAICAVLPGTVLPAEPSLTTKDTTGPAYFIHTNKCLENLKNSKTSIVKPVLGGPLLDDEELKYEKNNIKRLNRYIVIVHEDAGRYLVTKAHDTPEYVFQKRTASLTFPQTVRYCKNVLEAGVVDEQDPLYKKLVTLANI